MVLDANKTGRCVWESAHGGRFRFEADEISGVYLLTPDRHFHLSDELFDRLADEVDRIRQDRRIEACLKSPSESTDASPRIVPTPEGT